MSVHELALEELELRPVPPLFIPLPDLFDIYLRYCRYFYGDKAKDAATMIMETQRQAGLEHYGVPLTREVKIDAHLELLSELADAICYSLVLPLPDAVTKPPMIKEEPEPERTIDFALSYAVDAISALPVETRRSQVALEMLKEMLEALKVEAKAASGEDFENNFEEEELYA